MTRTAPPAHAFLWSFVVAAVVAPALVACDGWVEGICKDDEVSVHYTTAGGGYCRGQRPSDPDCPDGEIPREQRPSGRLDCVLNDVTAEPYASH